MRALVIGLGRMGRFHTKVLGDLGCDVTTVDPDPTAGADRLTCPRRYEFDVVCVATPIAHLAEVASTWAGATDHLLIEKPMAATAADADELSRALVWQRTAVGYVERFNPQVRALRAQAVRLGPIKAGTFIRSNWRQTGDVGLDLMSHDVDLARLMGVPAPVFQARCGAATERRIRLECAGGPVSADLMQHTTSPLHAQWHAFLSGRDGYATPADAVAVLDQLESYAPREAAV